MDQYERAATVLKRAQAVLNNEIKVATAEKFVEPIVLQQLIAACNNLLTSGEIASIMSQDTIAVLQKVELLKDAILSKQASSDKILIEQLVQLLLEDTSLLVCKQESTRP